jgi:hypothetical protein
MLDKAKSEPQIHPLELISSWRAPIRLAHPETTASEQWTNLPTSERTMHARFGVCYKPVMRRPFYLQPSSRTTRMAQPYIIAFSA